MSILYSSVAILGRPNVGKSTLFNRLVGKNLALVHDFPGVTRDRRQALARLSDLTFSLVDTAGLMDEKKDLLAQGMWKQTKQAIVEADILFLVIDIRSGILPDDLHFANLVRRFNKPVILIANKCEQQNVLPVLGEASRLGLGEPIAFSAVHGEGLADLYQALKPFLEEQEITPQNKKENPLQLAIVGRPNVGKSTLINRFIQQERLLTSDQPGVTRDAIAIDWTYKGRALRLIDTAGMRKKSSVTTPLENLAVRDALRVIDYAQVVMLILDHETPLAKQDVVIANKVIDEGRVLVIGINKWDLIDDKEAYLGHIHHKLSHSLPQVKGVPCIPISALEGQNLDKILDECFKMYELWGKRITTGQLNRWLQGILAHHPPPLSGRSRIKIKYLTQIKTRPPTFALFASRADAFPDTYVRYLQNRLREDFRLPGIPIRIYVRGSQNPYVK